MDEKVEVNVITLDNGVDYMIVDALKVNDNNYFFLVNENDKMDFCIRKVIKENDKEYLVKLDSEEEFEDVMLAFNKKHGGEN